MIDVRKCSWSRLGKMVARISSALPRFQSSHAQPRPDCLARRYAECNDLAHCRYCSTVEQALRAASWTEHNWRRVQMRKYSQPVTR
jgi:hypothetical protein